tara:strand:+ start:1474 stop:2109 length:636 start_codon:yes stop_codon:yes gene_type:complete
LFAAPDSPIAEKGELLFSDDFERTELGDDWKVIIPAFTVANEVLVGTQARDDHGSVGRVYIPMKDFVVEFKFNLAGSKTFNVVFDDKNHKGSHAGHICRVAVTPTQIRLGDDKEGTMRNDIFEMRRDPSRKGEADELIKGRTTIVKTTVALEQWHTMTIEIAGDRMRVSLNGAPIGQLQSPGLAHPTKESLHFTVNGKDTLFDDVRIWKAK